MKSTFTDDLWRYTLAICGGLVVAWFLVTPAHAEPVAICFTDPANCLPCKSLDRSWQQAQPATRRIVIDVRTASRADLAKWGVESWPHTVLVEMDGERCTKVYRRHVGAMTPEQLRKFCEVPK